MKQLAVFAAVTGSLSVTPAAPADGSDIHGQVLECEAQQAGRPHPHRDHQHRHGRQAAQRTLSIRVTTPAGTKLDLGVASRCKRSDLEAIGRCARSAQILKHERSSMVASVQSGGLGDLPIEGVKAYKLSGSGGSGTAIIDGTEPQTGARTPMGVQLERSGSMRVVDRKRAKLLRETRMMLKRGVLKLTRLPHRRYRKIRVTLNGRRNGMLKNPRACTAIAFSGRFRPFKGEAVEATARAGLRC